MSEDGEKLAEKFKPVKIQIKSIQQEPIFVPKMQIATQQILFESGLAEHFVRLLADNSSQPSQPVVSQSQLPSSGNQTANTVHPLHNIAAMFTPDHSDGTETLNRTLQIIRTNLGIRQSRLTVQLSPPDLGKMNIEVKLIDSNLTLLIRTDTNHAKQALSQKLDSLRNTLQQQGINITRLEVVTRNGAANPNHNDQQYHHQFSQQSNQNFQNHRENDNRENHIPDDRENDETTQQMTLDMQNNVNLVA